MPDELKTAFGPTPSCPPMEELAEARHQRHLQECGYCSAQFALYQQFEGGVPDTAEKPVVAAIVSRLRKESPAAADPWWRRMWRMPVLAPAAMAMAALLIFFAVHNRPAMEPIGGRGDNVMRSAQLQAIAPKGEINAAPSQLSWQTFAGAARYAVRVSEVDRTEIWRGETASTSISLPGSVMAQIVPGRKLLLEITAIDSSGKQIASSGAQSFTVVQ